MMELAKHLQISGRVQGVFFRATTQAKAVELGLTGWVRNVPDGSVEALVQGEAERTQELIDWCWNGVAYARVTAVAVDDATMDETLTDFTVRY